MQTTSLIALAREELDQAREATGGRSAKTIVGAHGRMLRQTVMALRAGEELSAHENPGEATVQVLIGHVLLRFGKDSWSGSVGDLMTVPDVMHSLEAVEDSAILFTVVKTS